MVICDCDLSSIRSFSPLPLLPTKEGSVLRTRLKTAVENRRFKLDLVVHDTELAATKEELDEQFDREVWPLSLNF
jgi:hypothetical protein